MSAEERGDLRVLRVMHFRGRMVRIGIATGKLALDCLDQRQRVYTHAGYLAVDGLSRDKYDANAVIFAAVEDERLLGAARVVRGSQKRFPIEEAYTFVPPQRLADVPRNQLGEVGKLVVEGGIGGLLFATLGLINVMGEYGREEGMVGGYAFIKRGLLDGFMRLGIPLYEMKDAQLIYPKSGPLAPYFFSRPNDVVPTFYLVDEVTEVSCDATARFR